MQCVSREDATTGNQSSFITGEQQQQDKQECHVAPDHDQFSEKEPSLVSMECHHAGSKFIHLTTGGPIKDLIGTLVLYYIVILRRPRTRWRDDLIHHVGLTWQWIAQDRYRWLKSREGFLIWVILTLID